MKLPGKWKIRGVCTTVNHPFDRDANGVAVELSKKDKVYTVFFFEDPSDGYRSSMAVPIILENQMYDFGGNPNMTWLAERDIQIKPRLPAHNTDGFEFIDLQTKAKFLEIGTDHTDDYYPCFVMDYTPEKLGLADV